MCSCVFWHHCVCINVSIYLIFCGYIVAFVLHSRNSSLHFAYYVLKYEPYSTDFAGPATLNKTLLFLFVHFVCRVCVCGVDIMQNLPQLLACNVQNRINFDVVPILHIEVTISKCAEDIFSLLYLFICSFLLRFTLNVNHIVSHWLKAKHKIKTHQAQCKRARVSSSRTQDRRTNERKKNEQQQNCHIIIKLKDAAA